MEAAYPCVTTCLGQKYKQRNTVSELKPLNFYWTISDLQENHSFKIKQVASSIDTTERLDVIKMTDNGTLKKKSAKKFGNGEKNTNS